MPPEKRGHPALLALAVAICASAFPLISAQQPSASLDADEVRALWVLRTSLVSRQTIASMVDSARRTGFNTLLVQVRGRGDAYFNDGIEPRASALASQPAAFDPLRETLSAAHAAGLRVHAWVSVNLISSAADLPTARNHLVYRHPEWLMVPRRLVPQLDSISSGSPEYVGKIARWSRTQADLVEGLYLSPVSAGAADHTVAVVADLVRRYEVDGVHLDYVRYPTDEFDYSRESLAAFRTFMLTQIAPAVRQRLDLRLDVDATVYPDEFFDEWRSFRRARLTSLVTRLRGAVKAARPGTLLSAAVVPEAATAAARNFQDWPGWLDQGLIDIVCPMAYTQDPGVFKVQIEAARQAAGARPVWAGIGAYRLTTDQTVENIRTARRAGVTGVILFSYDSLVTPTAGADYLSQVARAAFTASGQ